MPRETRQKADSGPAVKLPVKKKGSSSGTGTENASRSKENKRVLGENVSEKVEKAVERNGLVENAYDNYASGGVAQNVLKGLDLLLYAPNRTRNLQIKTIQNHFVNKSIKQLTAADYAGRFTRRITALTWHEKYPYVLASASKFGDIMLISGVKPAGASNQHDTQFQTKAELQGGGAGYSVTAMKFHNEQMNILYRASIDCTVAKIDLVHGDTTQFYDTGDYNRWFCGMDVSFSRNMLIAGDNKGTAYKFSLDGKLMSTWRLHKNKIHHIEFSKKDPNLMVTSSLDKSEAVRIWDVRFLQDSSKDATVKPLQALPHSCGLNCAKFSPSDGSRLLTSDQHDEIRVYQGPLWMDYLTIKHHHKQFQHITPIKADWHPVNDYIVIGRYPPKTTTGHGHNLARAIEFFDSYSGKLVDMIYPPLDEICSLNVFNPTGEFLATGMNSKLILWKPGLSVGVAENSKSKPLGDGSAKNISETMRNVLRGRRAREYSPASDDDDDEDTTANKKKKSKTTAAPAAPPNKPNRKKK